ncbi:FliM/FliN family flagellar motor switch protein [Gellertiella hungarica]|nr:FliM/FliN family flagellar motor switch protein [Gellertiella hungarica]
MTEAPATTSASRMDPALLARLTGGLGDRRTIEKICADFGQLYSDFLPDVFHSETHLNVQVGYAGCEMGLMSDLIAEIGDDCVVADASLRNWCPGFLLTCGNAFVITLMEHMLGATADTIEEPVQRPLSKIEIDMAVMVFEKIASVLKSGVNAPGGFEAIIERPVNAEDRPKPAEDEPDQYAAAFRMSIALGPVETEFSLIVPQRALLKTTVVFPKSKGQQGKAQKEWAEQIGEQVRRSQVTLEARIKLQTLTLRTISKLAAGDVIPFFDTEDVHVDVSANGKEMYVCEFGKSGANYMVRVKDNVSSDDEILRHLMS